ncbi:DUF4350 domain-containing protein [Haloarchaeobius amylolyticus]|uniref:DUF4350 domain-containing protein n=1 Tax=Haloarchaeobius amylolyticus TaxID=1198296 RepID=UPI00226E72CD
MQRRTFLSGLATSAAVTTGLTGLTRAAQTIPPLAFDSTSSILAADGTPLSDDSLVAVWAEDTATNDDADDDGDAVEYSGRIPLVAIDDSNAGAVAGFGTMLVPDDTDFTTGNDEFVLNVWDALVGGGTVRWDESHGQFYDLGSFQTFESYAEANGYDVQATGDLVADLDGADALVVTTPADAFSDAEQTALADFVADGGTLMLHDQSDFSNYDQTDNLNAIADALGLAFRFNDDQVFDSTNNAGVDYVPTTTAFNDAFDLFADRTGIGDSGPDLEVGRTYEVQVETVTDGDTVDVRFPGGTVESIRVLGVDTPEKAFNAEFERPEEWEGLGDGSETTPLPALQFGSTSALVDADGSRLTDDDLVAVWAEDSARVTDADGNGDATPYGDDPIPLAAVDGRVAGFGSMLVSDGTPYEYGNEEFLLTVWDDLVGGGTVLWDESHGQYYGLSQFDGFGSYAEDNGYDVRATDDLVADLDAADAVVVTTPGYAFDQAEIDALAEFVSEGGAVFLHDQSDYGGYDATAAMNDLAAGLDLGFGFDDSQVMDDESNSGAPFRPTTTRFDDSLPYFVDRPGLGEETTYPYLAYWADEATDFARAELAGETVDLWFDPNEGVRDPFGRLLGYIGYDADDSGSRDALFNRRLIADGYARVYGSGLSRHESFWAAEADARAADRGLWAESDPENSPAIRNRRVESVFVPNAARVTVSRGTLGRGRVAAFAGSSASTPGAPLAAVDRGKRVAMVGGLLVDESYEADEDFAVSTATYENFVFLTNLLDSLAATDGDVLIDGGHGQFAADYALSSEDAAYYQRFLEGVGIGLEQVNDLTADRLGDARALLVTTPTAALSEAELDSLARFRARGGAVVLLGDAAAPADARENLNAVAAALGSKLRLSGDAVTDPEANVNEDPTIPVTGTFNPAVDVTRPVEPEPWGEDEDEPGNSPKGPTGDKAGKGKKRGRGD